jgi:hypothetical protein
MMKHPPRVLVLVFAAALACGQGCSDDVDPTTDGSAGPDGGGKLWPCPEPGKSCNAHDTCAINPICGQDKLCHPSARQNCDDNLGCTEDTCGGPGLCVNTPKDGWCAVFVKTGSTSETKCYPNGAPHPTDACKKCDTKQPTKWSDASGAKCDDEDLCTLNDVCKDGQCQGTYFGNKCGDAYQCTDDICDGKGGCKNELKKGRCLIDKTCYTDKQTDKAGCAVCEAAKEPYKWTALPNLCKIGASCHKPGDKDSSGCGVCDPAKSSSGWSPATDACFIAGVCYNKGDKDASGCGSCDPTKSQTAWTTAGSCLIRGTCYQQGAKSATGCGVCDAAKSTETWSAATGVSTKLFDFEAGLGGFTVDAAVNKVGWQVSGTRYKGGTKSLYYGDLTGGSYDNGAANKGSASSSAVSLPVGKKAALIFWLYMDTETASTLDVLTVKAGGTTVWTKSASTMGAQSFQRWIPVEIDLSSKAGSSVKIEFAFDTKDAWSNGGEGVYVDDVIVVSNCGV